MEHFNSETTETGKPKKECLRYLRHIKSELWAKEKTLSERDPAEDWMKKLISDIDWLICSLPDKASYVVVDSLGDYNFAIAAYYLTEEVDDGVRFKVMKCYSSPDAAVLEIVILIDTTPDRDRGVFYALQAFGDDDSEDF